MRLPKFLNLRSIRLQLLVAYVIALLLAAVAAGLMFFILFVWRAEGPVRKGLPLQAEWIADAIVYDASGRPLRLDQQRNSPWIYASIPDDLKYAVLDSAGTVLFSSENTRKAFVPPGLTFFQLPPLVRLQMAGIPMDLMTFSVRKGEAIHYIQVARSERLHLLIRNAIGWPMLKTAILVGVACLLLFVAVVYITLHCSLQTLDEASEAAARIAPANLSTRLDTSNLPSEVAPLVEAFNKALDRLERGYRIQQEFLAGAAHELKTPLALIRAQIELNGAADRTSLLSDVDMMARQVHQLLHLAEVSETHNYKFEPVSLAEVASEVTGYLVRLADLHQVSLQLQNRMADDYLVSADRSAVFIMLKNLIENAIRHAGAGGTVTVALDEAEVYVEDGGAGIAEADFPKLFARFWRGPERRDDGAGLGLAICHQIAVTHGWTIDARNALPGARFTLHLVQNHESGKSAVIDGAAL
ncbi:MAG: ATP-binding protein [Pseudomonadota bacterium]